MKISIRKEAEQEMMDAREWYEVRLPGLGDVLGLSVEQALDAIIEMPAAHPYIAKRFRHVLLRKFPFSLVYIQQDDEIIILSCFHHRRRPGSWRQRQ
ncbi:type II toxin-antitoxin system RelE/ParE family toxin [Isoalcanivorax indicus]|uniref:type II toxin-antitoxin system RelE/ParE family toxin n=1 Tax=Isoalcanivorax indicus TaxID=2202653 RepID=UPI000DBAA537|nr:type II toxin-antitoxin system RelE/ParE family toxin [Isoalcanivorax indicus]